MARLRLSVDPSATVPLRFDDPEFLEALENDDRDDAKKNANGQGPIASIFGTLKATDRDLSAFADDGYVLHAREAIQGKDEDAIANATQRQSGGVDIGALGEAHWSHWVLRVDVPPETLEDLPPRDRSVFAELSSPNRKTRGEALSKLPTFVRDGFRARLRAHVDSVSRPADRDPGKTDPKARAGSDLRDTGSNSNGDHSPSYGADL